jgi:hypothetical protein
MPKKDFTEIVVVFDKSGSMGAVRDDAIGGFNAFLKAQKAEKGEAALTVVLFDTDYTFLHKGVPIRQVPELGADYTPSGLTALLDALGRAIDETGKRLSDLPEEERPEKVIVAVITDGMENSSVEYSREQIFKMLAHQRDVYKWEFLFLAAGQEAIAEATALGIDKARQMDFGDRSNIRAAYDSVCCAVSNYRQGKGADLPQDPKSE